MPVELKHRTYWAVKACNEDLTESTSQNLL